MGQGRVVGQGRAGQKTGRVGRNGAGQRGAGQSHFDTRLAIRPRAFRCHSAIAWVAANTTFRVSHYSCGNRVYPNGSPRLGGFAAPRQSFATCQKRCRPWLRDQTHLTRRHLPINHSPWPEPANRYSQTQSRTTTCQKSLRKQWLTIIKSKHRFDTNRTSLTGDLMTKPTDTLLVPCPLQK